MLPGFRHIITTALTIFLFSGLVAAHTAAVGKDQTKPKIGASKINQNAPVIDGFLNDEVWNNPQLQFARDFIQLRPDDGQLLTESTLVAVVYDEKAIYFGFWCYDSEPDKIARQMVRRDRYGEADLIAVRIDPYHDHQNGYDFYVNAAGVQCDNRLFNDGHEDDAWNGVWESDVQMQPWGWSVEIRIPYHCLRFNEKENHIWGIDFARAINRKNESGRWAHESISQGGFASNFGHISGLKKIKPARHLEILPYAVGKLETMADERDFNGSAGVDLKYGISTDLTLDVTINPDFGQVELDEPVLNLSTFETNNPERRPFFLEGADLFRAEYAMFHSRRIGRRPAGDIEDSRWSWYDSSFAYYTDFPRATTIYGAAKLTGKLSNGTSIAFLSAVTQEEKAAYNAITSTDTLVNGTDTTYKHYYESRVGVVEPKAVYSVFRIKQDVFTNSSIGALLTVASQDTKNPAITGAVDWRLYTNNNVWCVRGQTVFSRVDDENIGFANDLVFEKISGKSIRGAIGTVIKDEHLQINHLGYTTRSDLRGVWLWVQYRTSDDWWIIRDSWNNINANASWNYDGDNIEKSCNFNNNILFTNNWEGGGGIAASFPDYDDRETRGNGIWERPKSWNAWIWIDTDERKKLSFEVDYNFGESRTYAWWSAEFLVRYRPISTLQFTLQTEYTRDWNQLMWVYNNRARDSSFFADKNQNIFDISFSASLMIHRNLSCQLSANGLITGLDYNNYRPYIRHGKYGDALPQYNRDSYFDRNYSALNSTLTIRWEYKPGSTVYLVWTRSREEVDRSANDLVMSRDFKRLFTGDAYNVFLIKANYWMNI